MYDASCYQYFAKKENWDKANSNCKTKYLNSHLVSIDSAAENNFVKSLLTSLSAKAWIGIKGPKKGKDVTWTDGSDLAYTNWATAPPQDKDCVYTNSFGAWLIDSCSRKNGYICELNAVEKMPTSDVMPSTVTVTRFTQLTTVPTTDTSTSATVLWTTTATSTTSTTAMSTTSTMAMSTTSTTKSTATSESILSVSQGSQATERTTTALTTTVVGGSTASVERNPKNTLSATTTTLKLPEQNGLSSSSSSTLTVVGAALGGTCVVVVAAVFLFVLCRLYKKSKVSTNSSNSCVIG